MTAATHEPHAAGEAGGASRLWHCPGAPDTATIAAPAFSCDRDSIEIKGNLGGRQCALDAAS